MYSMEWNIEAFESLSCMLWNRKSRLLDFRRVELEIENRGLLNFRPSYNHIGSFSGKSIKYVMRPLQAGLDHGVDQAPIFGSGMSQGLLYRLRFFCAVPTAVAAQRQGAIIGMFP